MTLRDLVAAELAEPVEARVSVMAAAIAAQYGDAARAVLFYGSCLRQRELDGLMLDFYLIVSDYDAAYAKRWLARANALIPPNVFPFAHDGLAAKYAVLSEADFDVLNREGASTVSVWARFAQPSRLVWSRDVAAADRAIAAVAEAAPTLFALARPIAGTGDDLTIWRAGFAQTYNAELRAERSDRSGSIVDADPDRYRAFGAAIESVETHATNPSSFPRRRESINTSVSEPDTSVSIDSRLRGNDEKGVVGDQPVASTIPMSPEAAMQRWRALQRRGKMMTVARLAKASLTFAGGIDYLAWKINRHAGTQITIKPWQRRWPLLGAVVLVPRLFLKGAIK